MTVSYTFYTDTYKGKKLSQEQFESLEDYSFNIVNNHCLFRLDDYDFDDTDLTWTDQIKKAICKTADALFDFENRDGLGGYSLADYSENYTASDTSAFNMKVKGICSNYLGRTGLLNKAVGCL